MGPVRVIRNGMLALTAAALLALPEPAAAQYDCTVTFSLDDAVTLGALSVDVDYDEAIIDFDGSGASVVCAGLNPSALGTFNEDEGTGVLSQGYLAPAGVTGPTDLAACDFVSTLPPVPGDFPATVTSATDPFLSPVNPLPTVSVTDISCTGGPTTTTSSTTTTTLGPGSTTTTSTTTTTTLPSNYCDVTIVLLLPSPPITLAALQFDVDYSGAGGQIEGTGSNPSCASLIGGVLATFSDNDAGEVLSGAYVSLSGIASPNFIAQCGFLYDTVPPGINDFTVTVTDATATNPADNPVTTLMRVSSVDCVGATTTTTTTSTTTSTTTTSTSTTTTTVPVCGDGIMQSGEECDDGVANSDTIANACRTDCALPWCGDDVVDTGEECDDGSSNSDAAPTACRLDCTEPAMCGDADDNGSVTAGDALRVLRAAVGIPEICEYSRCDSNGDGSLSASDAQSILQSAVGQSIVLDCSLDVMLRLDDAVTLGQLDLSVDYSATGDTFVGEATAASCAVVIGGGVVATFDNDTQAESLSVSLSSAGTFSGPFNLAECDFFHRVATPNPGDFVIQVVGAQDGGGSPVAPPSVSVNY